MGVISTGTTPLALPGGMNSVNEQAPANAPLYPGDLNKMGKKPKKEPKIKKRAFGQKEPGAAFRK